MKQSKEKGQSIIEVAIALGVAAIVIGAIVSTMISSLSTAQYNRDFNLATSLSQEGIEVARSLRDSVKYTGSNWCLPQDESEPDRPCPQDVNVTVGASQFFRQMSFTHNSPKCSNTFTEVIVTTSWTDGKCDSQPFCHESVISSCITNI